MGSNSPGSGLDLDMEGVLDSPEGEIKHVICQKQRQLEPEVENTKLRMRAVSRSWKSSKEENEAIETPAEAEVVSTVEEKESPSTEEEVTAIVEKLAGATTVVPAAPSNEVITAKSAPEASEAQIMESVSSAAAAEAPDALTKEEPAVDKAELAGTTANVEGRFGDPISGHAIVVGAGAVSAKVVFTAIAPLFGTCLSVEGSRLTMLM